MRRHDDMRHRPEIAGTFGSIEAFYTADARRRHSRERDVGLMWRGAAETSFRAAWVQETGEVYLCEHGHPADGGGTVSLLARRFGLGELHATLPGYAQVCGRAGSLAWLLERVEPVSGRALSRRDTGRGSRARTGAAAGRLCRA